jgi:uncharacterized protein (TIGR04255 family)
MKIPKKINPDHLKDTLVQILFNSATPPELVLGQFNIIMKDTLKFVAASPKKREVKVNESEGIILESLERGYFLDSLEEVKVDIGPNNLVFNMYKGYIGWEKFFPLISSTLTKLFESDLIKDINRIGLRYISQFDNTDLFDNINVNSSVNIPGNKLEATQIRNEYTDQNFRIILTLINRIKLFQGNVNQDINSSVIDVDVIQLFSEMNNSRDALKAIDDGHYKQKVTFFSLLTPSFLETLNPEY